jgi:hypothetical protein
MVEIPIDGGKPQVQPMIRPIGVGINELCQYTAITFTFLLGLDVWNVSKK